jgi:hypothetical protein
MRKGWESLSYGHDSWAPVFEIHHQRLSRTEHRVQCTHPLPKNFRRHKYASWKTGAVVFLILLSVATGFPILCHRHDRARAVHSSAMHLITRGTSITDDARVGCRKADGRRGAHRNNFTSYNRCKIPRRVTSYNMMHLRLLKRFSLCNTNWVFRSRIRFFGVAIFTFCFLRFFIPTRVRSRNPPEIISSQTTVTI